MKRLMTIVVLLLTSPLAPAADNVPRVAPEDFAILPWGWTNGEQAVFDDIKACGFNLAGFVAPDRVPLVEAAGLKCIISDGAVHVGKESLELKDEEIRTRATALATRFKDNPAVYGYYLRDEPSADLYPVLGKFAGVLREVAPNQRAYVNLFPSVCGYSHLKVDTYEEYVEKLIEIVKPPFVSYDHYALLDDGTVADRYYANLEIIRTITLKHGLPFWNIVLGNSHFHYAEPTEDTIRFQAYTTMAYGARGLSYFTYFTPTHGNYRLGAIDQFGHKTPTWEALRRVNLQIHRLAPTLVKLKSVNVFHHPNVPEKCRGMDTAKVVAEIISPEARVVVGEFEGPNQQPYAMLVNKDIHRSARIDVKLKSAGQVMVVNPYTGAVEPWVGEHKWLSPGGGALLTVKP